HISNVLVWDKKKSKYKNLLSLLKIIRLKKYDKVINVQRYFTTGMLTALSRAKEKIGFDKNPLSLLFNVKIKHTFDISNPRHEVERNNDLIQHFTDNKKNNPVLYPTASDYEIIREFTLVPFITITPSSVWFTKKYPLENWIELINRMSKKYVIYLLGGPNNADECEHIIHQLKRNDVFNLSGRLSFLESAALMKFAVMNYTNDSAPLHFASAMNAPVTAIFCSTVPAFGYTPLSDISHIVETDEKLTCRPCGLHGKKTCPERHFKCAMNIDTQKLLEVIDNV
ncbi:MAG: glycosyltransferase family 9 protein, partial [Ferruginibacter sp.]|nr:glycosyltransferase family 9 protein [Ferruginibacter sp.]